MNLNELYFRKQRIDGLSINSIGKNVIFFEVNKSLTKIKIFLFQAFRNTSTHRRKPVIGAWVLWYEG